MSLILEDATIYVWRGDVYRTKGVLDLAILDFSKAIDLDPNSATAYAWRGDVYRRKGDLDLALIDLNKAIELNPKYAWAHGVRSDVHERKGDLDQALIDLNKAIEPTKSFLVDGQNISLEEVHALDGLFVTKGERIFTAGTKTAAELRKLAYLLQHGYTLSREI